LRIAFDPIFAPDPRVLLIVVVLNRSIAAHQHQNAVGCRRGAGGQEADTLVREGMRPSEIAADLVEQQAPNLQGCFHCNGLR
jgi:hypothetical protein